MGKARPISLKRQLAVLFASGVLALACQAQQSVRTGEPEQGDFSMETEIVPIKKPVDLPRSALKALAHDSIVSSCLASQNLPSDQLPAFWFVASEIHLNGPEEADLIVLPSDLKAPEPMHPAPNACFVGPYTVNFWVLRMTQGGCEVALSVHTHDLGVRKTRSKGYRDIETSISNLNGSTTTLFRFDGKHYKAREAPLTR